MESNAQLQELFSKPEYSDLTIKLSDGQEFRIHKLIVCARNEYFLKLCGPQSHFAGSQEKAIQLKDDDPLALEHVLRHLYGFALSESGKWRFWMNLHVTADKYLIPKLSEVASDRFCVLAKVCKSADDIFDIIELCRNDLNHNEVFVTLAASLREKNLIKLLSNDRFRAQLDSGGKEALWEQLDELTAKVFSVNTEEKSYSLCPGHTQNLFQRPTKDGKAACFCCNLVRAQGWSQSGPQNQAVRKAWIEK